MSKLIETPWMAYDTGNGMRVCPADCADALIPQVAAVQNEIVRIPPPPDGHKNWDEIWTERKFLAHFIAAGPDLLEASKQAAAGIMEALTIVNKMPVSLENRQALRTILTDRLAVIARAVKKATGGQ